MESNFHSTVLQRPSAVHDQDEERERDRNRDRDRDERRRRDILNPVQLSQNGPVAPSAANPIISSASASSSSSSAQPPHHAFNLRSPTQPDFHGPHFPGSSSASPSSASAANPSAAAASTNNPNTNANGATSRSGLHNPFLTSAAPPSLPPAAAPPRSPLHAPPHLFYPQDMRDARDPRDPPRDKTVSNFYDPTTDTVTTTATSDRRVSDTGSSRHNATQSQASSSNVSEPEQDISDRTHRATKTC